MSWESHGRYVAAHGENLFDMLQSFIIELRVQGDEVLFFGDLNACTGVEGGWNGSEAMYTEGDMQDGQRVSDCGASTVDREGRALLRLCGETELRILNGLRCGARSFSSGVTRPLDKDWSGENGEGGGHVLDYYIASEAVLQQCAALEVLPSSHFSDHRPVKLSWNGYSSMEWAKLLEDEVTARVRPKSNIVGWKLSGVASEPRAPLRALQHAVAAEMGEHRDTRRVADVLQSDGPDEAYRLIHMIIRDSWERVGAKVVLSAGVTSAYDLDTVPDLPVNSWADDEVLAALREWHAQRRRVRRMRSPTTLRHLENALPAFEGGEKAAVGCGVVSVLGGLPVQSCFCLARYCEALGKSAIEWLCLRRAGAASSFGACGTNSAESGV